MRRVAFDTLAGLDRGVHRGQGHLLFHRLVAVRANCRAGPCHQVLAAGRVRRMAGDAFAGFRRSVSPGALAVFLAEIRVAGLAERESFRGQRRRGRLLAGFWHVVADRAVAVGKRRVRSEVEQSFLTRRVRIVAREAVRLLDRQSAVGLDELLVIELVAVGAELRQRLAQQRSVLGRVSAVTSEALPFPDGLMLHRGLAEPGLQGGVTGEAELARWARKVGGVLRAMRVVAALAGSARHRRMNRLGFCQSGADIGMTAVAEIGGRAFKQARPIGGVGRVAGDAVAARHGAVDLVSSVLDQILVAAEAELIRSLRQQLRLGGGMRVVAIRAALAHGAVHEGACEIRLLLRMTTGAELGDWLRSQLRELPPMRHVAVVAAHLERGMDVLLGVPLLDLIGVACFAERCAFGFQQFRLRRRVR